MGRCCCLSTAGWARDSAGSRLRADPGTIPALVIYEPPMRTGAPLGSHLEEIRKLVRSGNFEEALMTFLTSDAGTSPAEAAMFRASPIWPGLVALAPTTVPALDTVNALGFPEDDLRAQQIPTLLLRGSATTDPVIAETADRLSAVLPAVSTVLLDGQTHHALMTAPGLVADAIRNFIGRPGPYAQ
jgi:pimeloyl-ACP methyl ester carboxylesterase